MDQPKFKPGDKVYRQYAKKGSKEALEFGLITGREYGVVIDSFQDEAGDWNCWVAFWGARGFPKNSGKTKPYVLRYYDTSLIKWERK